MKKNKNFAFGFTIAELLITMLISAIVAAAMVPVVGLKKIKFPINRFNHGIAECYYEPTAWNHETGDPTQWQLSFYYADNKRRGDNNGAGSVADGQNFCSFQPPKAEFYQIIVIGAGTDGSQITPTVPMGGGVQMGTAYDPQPISTGPRFQATLNDAVLDLGDGEERPIGDMLREIITSWYASDVRRDELFARYELVSPYGGSGDNLCNSVNLKTFNPSRYQDCTTPWLEDILVNRTFTDAPPQFCNAYIARQGEPSGHGLSVIVENPHIDPNNDIFVHRGGDFTGLTYSSQGSRHEYKVFAAGKGRSWRFENAFYHSPNGPDPANARCTLNDSNCSIGGHIKDMTQLGQIFGNSDFKFTANEQCSRPSNGSRSGVVRYFYGQSGQSTTEDAEHADRSPLVWRYNPLEATVISGHHGESGEEKSVVYENLRGTIYMYPAVPQSNAAENDMGSNNLSYVMTNPDDPHSVLVSAASGRRHGQYEQMTFQMINSDIPIPRVPLNLAKTFDSEHYDYIAKLATSPYNGGLKGCETVGPEGEWCPGFAGKGIYFYLSDVPDAAAISITNTLNGRTFAIPTDQVRQDIIERDDNFNLCDDNFTSPEFLTNYDFRNADNQIRTFDLDYCRERKQHGSPGAVIIMW